MNDELIKRNEYCLGLLFDKDHRDPVVQDVYHMIMKRIIELEDEINDDKGQGGVLLRDEVL